MSVSISDMVDTLQDDSINETRPQTSDGEMKLMTLIILNYQNFQETLIEKLKMMISSQRMMFQMMRLLMSIKM